jgi:hypothetical protein
LTNDQQTRAEFKTGLVSEADRLITESQELFAQQKSTEAIQLLRKAHELDKKNSLARSILANALVEHARSFVETDWLEAEKLVNQALSLDPAHPTAKTILNLIVERKTTSSVEDWVSQARKLQSSGDLFAALAWVAEGLAVHPHEPKLLQIQDAIQHDQEVRRRQARRGDLEDLRRLQREIDGAADIAAKQALAERIQTVAAKHWTDGEILSIANALLLRLGLVSQESSSASPRGKGATVILHVPRLGAPKPSSANVSQIAPSNVTPSRVAGNVPAGNIPTATVPSGKDLPSQVLLSPVLSSKVPSSPVSPSIVLQEKVLTKAPEARPSAPPAAAVAVPSAPETKVTSQQKQPAQSNLTTLVLVSAAVAIVAVAATLFFARKYYARPAANTPSTASTASAPTVSAPNAAVSSVSAPAITPSAPTTAESALPASSISSETRARKVTLADRPNDRPDQQIRIRKGEQARLIFNLQPQPHTEPQPPMASLTIQGGAPGTTVFLDQTLVGSIRADGTLSVSTVNPGDHIVELRKERFKPRQFNERFVAGGTISLAAADAALEAAPGELKITFTPADANVAIVKGERLTVVSSGVPLNLAAGTYTLTARTADRFTRTSTLEVVAGQSKTLDLPLAPNGMSKWDDPGTWKQEKDSFIRKGGDFVLYGIVPASGTFVFSAMPNKSHLLQWVLNYTDPKNYVLFQVDDNSFYRTVIRNGQKTDEITVPDKSDKKSFRTIRIRVSATEIVHEISNGNSWTVVDRWTQPGANLGLGKFGFYIPGNDQVALSNFSHYADLSIH